MITRRKRHQTLTQDPAINHDMGDMDILGPELARQTLRQRAQPRLGGRKRAEIRPAAQAARSPREDECAGALLQESRNDCLRSLEATERVLAPVRFELRLADLQKGSWIVAASVVYRHRQRRQAMVCRHETACACSFQFGKG